MHDDGVVFGMGQLFCIQAKAVVIFTLGRDETAIHAFLLQAQHHHHVYAFQPLFHIVEHLDTELGDARGH